MKTKNLNDILSKGMMKFVLSFIAFIIIAYWYDGIEDYGKLQMFTILFLHIIVFILFYYSYKDKTPKYAIWGLYIGIIWNFILIFLIFQFLSNSPTLGTELVGVLYLTYQYYKSSKELKTCY
jgi:hypothetical protein